MGKRGTDTRSGKNATEADSKTEDATLSVDTKSAAVPMRSESQNSLSSYESNSDGYSDGSDCSDSLLMADATCLFCSDSFKSPVAMYVHCYDSHSFDVVNALNSLPKLEQVHYARFVNFVRAKKPDPKDLEEMIANKNLCWEDEKYAKNTIDDDAVLCFDVTEDLAEILDELKKNSSSDKIEELPSVANKQYEDDSSKLESLRKQYADLLHTVQTMRGAMQRVLEEGTEDDKKDGTKSNRSLEQNGADNEDDDEPYDTCYNRLAIHSEMLKDEHRTTTYIRALTAVFDHLARHQMLDSVHSLLDVGCGTGILALAGMRAAKSYGMNDFTVIAVDHARKIIQEAREIAKQNGKPYDQIQFIDGSVEHCQLPVKKVDIIVSEWMGYGLFSECMLDSVIVARNRFLKPDGLLLPHQCSLYACLISDDQYYKDVVEYWTDVYGFRMDNLTPLALREASIEQVGADSLVSSSECVKVIDVKTCKENYLPFETELQFKINRTCIVHGITMFFTADFQNFDLVRTERLSTAPTDRLTHWKQSTFFLQQAMMVTIGDVIECTVRFSRNASKLGRVNVSCSIFEQNQTFLL